MDNLDNEDGGLNAKALRDLSCAVLLTQMARITIVFLKDF